MRLRNECKWRSVGLLAAWVIGGFAAGEEVCGLNQAIAQTSGPTLPPAQSQGPGWVEAVLRTIQQGTPTVLVVTSAKVPGSHEAARTLLLSSAVRQLGSQVTLAELSAESEPQQVQRMRLTSLPCLVVYGKGKTGGLESVLTHRGLLSPDEFTQWLVVAGVVRSPRRPDPALVQAAATDVTAPTALQAPADASVRPVQYCAPSPSSQAPSPPVKYLPQPTPTYPAPPREAYYEQRPVQRQVVRRVVPRRAEREVMIVERPAPRRVVREVEEVEEVEEEAPTRNVLVRRREAAPREAAPTRVVREAAPTRVVREAAPTRVVREVEEAEEVEEARRGRGRTPPGRRAPGRSSRPRRSGSPSGCRRGGTARTAIDPTWAA